MWTRKEIRTKASASLRRNFWTAVAVCFILAFTGAEFYGSVSFLGEIRTSLVDKISTSVEEDTSSTISNYEAVIDWLSFIPNDGFQKELANSKATIGPIFDSLTSSFSAFFSFLVRSDFRNWLGLLLAIIGTIGGIWFMLWVRNALIVGERRFFLENRAREGIGINAILVPFDRGHWWPAVRAMLLRYIFLLMWSLTIVGFFIKAYSYRMVPYIMSENPKLKAREAIRLSRTMMDGNKWKTFLFDLVLWLQWCLVPAIIIYGICIPIGKITNHIEVFYMIAGTVFGVYRILWFNLLRSASFAEIYVVFRQQAVSAKLPLCEQFIEPALGELDPQVLPAGSQELMPAQTELVFHQKLGKHKINYDRSYSGSTLVLLFFSFSFIGWCWEVMLFIVQDGRFCDRGTMVGPCLPIYGVGGIVVLLFLRRLFNKPIALFFVSMIVCSAIEYFTSWYLQTVYDTRWWDYSSYFFNINGRICLEGAIIFGLGCCFTAYCGAPLLAEKIEKLPYSVRICCCCVLLLLFSTDAAYSHFHPNKGVGVTNYTGWQGNKTAKAGVLLHPTRE